MLVYRADDTPVHTAAALDRLIVKAAPGRTRTHDALTELFIDLTEVESAIADRQFPERDGLDPFDDRATRRFVTGGTCAHRVVGR